MVTFSNSLIGKTVDTVDIGSDKHKTTKIIGQTKIRRKTRIPQTSFVHAIPNLGHKHLQFIHVCINQAGYS